MLVKEATGGNVQAHIEKWIVPYGDHLQLHYSGFDIYVFDGCRASLMTLW